MSATLVYLIKQRKSAILVWWTKSFLWELKSFVMQKLSFVSLNKYGRWSREVKTLHCLKRVVQGYSRDA